MSLIKFSYLRKKRMLTLIVILTLTSSLFSITAYSFLGFYNGFTGYVGEQKDVVAVYSKTGSTPFTGIVPLDLSNDLLAMDGVVAVSPEAIAPATVNGQAIFVRGVVPQELTKLNPLTITEGSGLNINDTDSAIVGQNLANRLVLKQATEFLSLAFYPEDMLNCKYAAYSSRVQP